MDWNKKILLKIRSNTEKWFIQHIVMNLNKSNKYNPKIIASAQFINKS